MNQVPAFSRRQHSRSLLGLLLGLYSGSSFPAGFAKLAWPHDASQPKRLMDTGACPKCNQARADLEGLSLPCCSRPI